MKGISLPINTVIIIALAVVVLVALFLFFTGGFVPPKDDVLFRTEQTQLCTQHANDDPGCTDGTSMDSRLVTVCSQLGFSSCTSASDACLQSCCRSVCSGISSGSGGGTPTVEDCAELGGECENACPEANTLSPSGSGACDPAVQVCCDVG